jgi:hypothetical protein
MPQKLGVAVLLAVGCAAFRPHVDQTIDDDWTSQLDGDLKTAVDHSEVYFADRGWKIELRWAGLHSSSYAIERGPTGEPIRKSVDMVYVFYHPVLKRCFYSIGASLIREHLGGGRYGEPQFYERAPVNDDGSPVNGEVVCSAVDTAKGGVRVHVAGTAPSSTAVVASAPESSTTVASTSDPVTRLAPELPKPCADYVRAACTRADRPSGTDQNHFCSDLVDKMNMRGLQSGAEKKCRTMLKNQAR